MVFIDFTSYPLLSVRINKCTTRCKPKKHEITTVNDADCEEAIEEAFKNGYFH